MERMRVDNLGSVGLNTDVQPYLLPPQAWTGLYNCRTQDGELRSVPGERKLFDLSIKPQYHKDFVGPTGIQYLVVSDGASVHLYDIRQGTFTNITPASGTWGGGYVSFPILNGVLVVNSETDGPFYLDTSVALGPMLPLPGWDALWRCREMVTSKYYLIALNMTEDGVAFPYKLRWSVGAPEGDLPTEWLPTVENDAGTEIAGETPGEIVGARLVRDSLYVVKEDGIYNLTWTGGDFIFELERMKGGIGTRLQKGFTEMLGQLVVFTTSDLEIFDGTQSRSLVDARVRRGIFDSISNEFWEFSEVFLHEASSTLFIAGVTGGYQQLSIALTYNYEENTWGSRFIAYSYGFDEAVVNISGDTTPTWDELIGPVPAEPPPGWVPGEPWDDQTGGSWNKGVYAPSTKDIIIYETNDTDTAWWVSVLGLTNTNSDGTNKTCRAERIAVPVEGAEGLAMVTRVWPEIRGDAVVDMWIGAQEAANGEVVWDGPYPITPGQTESFDPLITGRYIAYKLESNSPGSWSLGAITVEWESAGER